MKFAASANTWDYRSIFPMRLFRLSSRPATDLQGGHFRNAAIETSSLGNAEVYQAKEEQAKRPGNKAMTVIARHMLKKLYGWDRSGKKCDEQVFLTVHAGTKRWEIRAKVEYTVSRSAGWPKLNLP